jgi:hypothetical protein
MCYAVPEPVYFTWQCAMRHHNQCIGAGNVLCGTTTNVFHSPHNTLPSEIHWLWWYLTTHCQVKYTGCGTVWHTTRWVPQPVYFSWQCVMRYHNLCISPGNVLCGTRTSVFHLAICYAGEIHWLWYRITHCQVKYTCCGTVWHNVKWNTLVVVPHNTLPAAIHWLWCRIVLCGTTTSVFHLAMCYAVPRPGPFTWQCVMLHHDQCNLAICLTVP